MNRPPPITSTPASSAPEFLSGGGACGERLRAFDWQATPLGRPDRWPQALTSAVSICLNAQFPICIYWGKDLTLLYNDAWSPIPGDKHPWALGRPAKEVWKEIWHLIGPLFQQVLTTGEGTFRKDELLPMHRHGYTEECYFDYTFSPIRGAGGAVEGVFNAVTETTYRVIAARRGRVLRDLAAATARAKSAEDACRLAAESLSSAAHDVPFSLLYLIDPEAEVATLAGASGLPACGRASPEVVSLANGDDAGWPVARVAVSGREEVLKDVTGRFGDLPSEPWPEPPTHAVVHPVAATGRGGVAAVLVAGVSPRRALDDDYRSFFQLVCDHVATAVANARAYQEERRRAEQLAELDRAKTAFFSNVSHEFRTPLTLILGPLEDMLGPDGEVLPRNKDALTAVHRNAQRLLKLVNNLLDFSRIEAGRVQASYEPTDLSAYTAELASMFRSAAERAGVRLVIDCPPLPEPVYVDRDMWEKVVLNLLSNAFKFTLEGEIRVRLRADGGCAVLSVEDTGLGIPAEEVPRLFNRFHRVEGAKGRTHEGSGIGLALVQELARLHGGEATAASAYGTGSTFTVRLPLGTAHLPQDRVTAPGVQASTTRGALPFVEEALHWLPHTEEEIGPVGQTAAGTKPVVILADDNADMRHYISRLLSADYEVIAVGDGEEALRAASRLQIDLVLTDVMMPTLDGFGLLKALRGRPDTASVPVIMLSARAGEEARVEGLSAGADDYLVKPFSARELLARVSSTLAVAGVRQAALRREEELLASARAVEGRLERVLGGIRDQFFILDNDWRYVFLNDRVVEATGRARSELLGQRIWDVFPDTAGTPFEAALRRAAATRSAVHFEYHYASLDRWFENRVHPSPDGLTVLVTDTTERKRVEERLSASEERFRAFMDHSPTAAWVTDADGRLRYVSATYTRLFKVLASAVVGASPTDLYPPELAEQYVRNIRAVAESGKPIETVEPGPRPDGTMGEFLVYKFPLPGDERLVGGVAIDISERLRAEAELREADRKKDEFLALLAHELRNPLAPLRNGLQVLRLATTDAGAAARARDMMDRQLTHMVRLIDDLLDVSRISRNKLTLRRERLKLSDVVSAAVETARPAIEASGHELAVLHPREPVELDADLTRLAQVLSNLLTNSAKYTPPGGRIRLVAELSGTEAVITVTDTGIGIPRESLPRIFDMFSQVDRSIERSTGGLGIGLALVKGLVEMHGGTVTAESEGHGQGSTFTVRLPVAEPLGTEPQASAGGQAATAALSLRVLVVDDNRDSAESMAMMLGLLGCEVETAYDGVEAVEKVELRRPDVVLMDVGMPRLNGYEATRRIRQNENGIRPTIVALTGWGQEGDRERSREAGCDGHLVKPVALEDLQRLLSELPRPAVPE